MMAAAMHRDSTFVRTLTVWLTGLSGAGKSTLAAAVKRCLADAGTRCCVLDGDQVRAGINRDLGFGPQDRRENIRRVAEIARLMNEAGLVVIAALISPYRADRSMAREIIGPERFVEVYLDAPLEVCERRDPKGLYRKARARQLAEFTGITAPYEPPQSPASVLHTGTSSVAHCVSQLLELVNLRLRPA
jgi:adenylyl-sulfate kinase